MGNQTYNQHIKFKLNPSALLVNGASRALICDIDRQNHTLIPLALSHILSDTQAKTIAEVVAEYAEGDPETAETLHEYFNFLVEKDVIFFSEFVEYYENIDLKWDFPAVISNAIIDFGTNNIAHLPSIVKQLDALNCGYLQLRFFEEVSINMLQQVLDNFQSSIVQDIDIVLTYQNHPQAEIEALICDFPRVKSIIIYNHPAHLNFAPLNTKGRGKLVTFPNDINVKSCGVVESFYFSSNRQHFTESLQHNTCLNRKISIDTDGNIKNCPSMVQNFGNIQDTPLKTVIENPDFKKYWNITKDQISICKDCEFRHICTDCRAYIENPSDIYSKPLKCGYNPYTCEWEAWSTNPLKQQAIAAYGGFSPSKTLIA